MCKKTDFASCIDIKKSASKEADREAGTELISQVVTNQVFSSRKSLTAVFGKGTGGTSLQ